MTAITEQLLFELGGRLGVRRFDEVKQLSEDKDGVADATQKFILKVSPSTRFILIVSNPASPLVMRHSAGRMRTARSLLSDGTRDAIELPLIEGEYQKRSYALWLMRNPLSSNRVLFKIQKTVISPSVFRWIYSIAAQSLHHGESAQLVSYIERLQDISALPEYIQVLASAARHGFSTGQIAPLRVLQHGDLWIGNVVRAPTPMGFIVVDWPGATADGLPFFDLVKFACSIGTGPKQLRRRVEGYSALIGCEVAMAMPYVLAGLGRLHLELEYFPERRFLALCEQKIGALKSVL